MVGSLRMLMFTALVAPGIALAASIDDGAKLFSKGAIEKAEAKIKEIKRVSGRDVVVETFAEATNPERAKKEKGDYFNSWVESRYKARDVRGVYILICMKPTWVQVAAGPVTEKMGFDVDRRRALREQINTAFKEKENPERFDAGLLAAVSSIAATLDHMPRAASTPVTRQPVPSSGDATPDWMGWVCVGGVALLAVWLVVGLIRAFSGAGGGGYGPGGPGYGGGGGFVSSLFGGLLGAAAGMYLYNSFFGSGTSGAYGAGYGSSTSGGVGDDSVPRTEGGGGWDEPAGGGDGGAGGDWGQDGGGAGGDWGGDTGGAGGDWGGGGDVGGGGDWGGGGGGGGDW